MDLEAEGIPEYRQRKLQQAGAARAGDGGGQSVMPAAADLKKK
jgi:hypothetical protein